MTCYLCAPDEYPTDDDDALDAWNEACSECDARYWSDPVFIIVDQAAESEQAS